MDWLQIAINDKRIDFFDFHEEFNNPVFIAQGGFGAIYRATGKKRSTKQYALKYLSSLEYDPLGYDSLVNELRLLRQVDDEDFVARCYGVSRDPKTNSYILVLKYVEQGSLADYLKKNEGRLTWADRLRLAYQITEALDYIHDRCVIHRDLHSGNILINAAGRALITDFGLSRTATGKTSKLAVQGRVPYIPPERIASTMTKHDERGDVYSLGVIFWEISADGIHPFSDADYMTPFRICQGERENPIEGTPEEYVKLYTQCWDGDPVKRPKMAEILARLAAMMKVEVGQKVKDMEDELVLGDGLSSMGTPPEPADSASTAIRDVEHEGMGKDGDSELIRRGEPNNG
ncbi:kinase-like domain-containing protein [Jimgerdemannia flammicorona]|uniref:Kinase-like domain-containing protein n=1 Tax=Jimgerdemannia flammicorona TaxID=994334 RepID=A0A432ZZR6_9FUNG|nr:kinase-like domain-containing protein [Jimgerdemannia flammicorona]